MKKWITFAVVGLIVVLLGIGLSARLILTKDFLVRELEGSINSRVQIGDVNVSIISFPAKVSLREVIIAERDDIAEKGIAYDERPSLSEGALELDSLSFEVSLNELLSRRIHVDHFELDGLHLRVDLYEDGSNSLDALFASPNKEITQAPEKPERKPNKKSEQKAGGFNAKEQQDFVTHLESVEIRNVSFDLNIEKTGLFVHGSECGVSLNDIRVDPQALEKVNEARLQFQSKVEVFDSDRKKIKYGELGLSGPALARLFDPTTGDIDPIVSLDLLISEDSHISSKAPYLRKIWKFGEKLSKFGISLGTLPDRATFGRKRKLAGSYQRGRVDFSEDISLLIHDWEAALNKPSWLDSADEQHEFYIDLSASKKASRSPLKYIETLVKNVPKEARGELSDEMLSSWVKNDKLTVSLHTRGELSQPEIELLTEVPDIEKLIKDYAKKSALDYLFKKLGN